MHLTGPFVFHTAPLPSALVDLGQVQGYATEWRGSFNVYANSAAFYAAAAAREKVAALMLPEVEVPESEATAAKVEAVATAIDELAAANAALPALVEAESAAQMAAAADPEDTSLFSALQIASDARCEGQRAINMARNRELQERSALSSSKSNDLRLALEAADQQRAATEQALKPIDTFTLTTPRTGNPDAFAALYAAAIALPVFSGMTLVDGSPEVEAPDPNAVPASVTAKQFKLALDAEGLYDACLAAVNAADNAVRINWETSPTFERVHPMIAAMASALGYTAQQVDDVFRLAATL